MDSALLSQRKVRFINFWNKITFWNIDERRHFDSTSFFEDGEENLVVGSPYTPDITGRRFMNKFSGAIVQVLHTYLVISVHTKKNSHIFHCTLHMCFFLMSPLNFLHSPNQLFQSITQLRLFKTFLIEKIVQHMIIFSLCAPICDPVFMEKVLIAWANFWAELKQQNLITCQDMKTFGFAKKQK